MLLSEIQDNPKMVEEIKVKSYISILDKMVMIQGFDGEEQRFVGIVDDCIKEKEGIFYIDHITKEISFVMAMIQRYTDIDIDEIKVDNLVYDFCITSGIWDKVVKDISSDELNMVKNLLNDTLEQELKVKNSIEGILNRNLQALINKLPNEKQMKSLSKSLVKDLNNFNWDKIPMLKQLYNNINEK